MIFSFSLLVMRIEIASPSFSYQTVLPFSLTFFVSKESYKETASLLKKDSSLLPSLNSFFKGDGYANESFNIIKKGTELINAFSICNKNSFHTLFSLHLLNKKDTPSRSAFLSRCSIDL